MKQWPRGLLLPVREAAKATAKPSAPKAEAKAELKEQKWSPWFSKSEKGATAGPKAKAEVKERKAWEEAVKAEAQAAKATARAEAKAKAQVKAKAKAVFEGRAAHMLNILLSQK